MKRILLIDDDKVSNFINERLISNSGVAEQLNVCISAISGLKLLNDCIESAPEQIPEIILLDIKMPVMDGFGFLEEFKKLPASFTEGIKIAMLTSSLEENDMQRSFQYENVIDFINKPLSDVKIRELLNKI